MGGNLITVGGREATCRILLISRSVLTKEFFDISKEVLNDLNVSLDVLYLESYDHEEVRKALSPLRKPDVALLSLMGDHAELLEIMKAWLAETPVVFALSTGQETVALTRVRGIELGEFLSGSVRGERATSGSSYYDPRALSTSLRVLAKSVGGEVGKYLMDWAALIDYWRNWRRENIVNMFRLVLRDYCGLPVPEPSPPLELGDFWVEGPGNATYSDLKEFVTKRGGPPSVVVLAYSGQSYFKGKKVADYLMGRLKFSATLYSNFGRTLKAFGESATRPELLIDIQWFRLARSEEDLKTLKALGSPVLGPVVMYGREIESWASSPYGLSPIELIYAVALPEADGVIEPILLAGLRDEGGTKVIEVVQDRAERVVRRAERWIALRNKPNWEKKIALVIYNYPPGEENIGRASYLDTLKSLEVLIRAMKDAGYKVREVSAEEIKNFFVSNPNSGKWNYGSSYTYLDLDTYLSLFNGLEEELRKKVVEQWGEPPGNVMVRGDKIALPVLDLGNVVIVLQPSRGWHEEPERIYHSSELYPHHQYIALYRWLEDVWKADAVVHVGTHGTLEFLPGKQVGLSSSCPPDALLGNLPNVYIYNVTVIGEGTIAKRRSYAVTVGHLQPRVTEAGLSGELRKIRELIDEYEEAKAVDPPRAELVLKSIYDLAKKYGLDGLGLEVMHDELIRMERSAMPYGLRVLGEEVSDEELLDYLTIALRRDLGGVKSLHRLVAEALGHDYDRLLESPGKNESSLKEVDAKVREILTTLVRQGLNEAVEQAKSIGVHEEHARETLKLALDLAGKLKSSPRLEVESVLNALAGHYVPPGLGGDYVLDPEVLPAGRNIYALDPLKIPSDAALDLGARIAEESVRKYLEQNGRYPESVGVVAWGGQEVRTRGVTIGQALRYLGVRLKHRPGTREPVLEVIPLEELGRPRIDVVVTMSGVFRDMFPNLIALIDRAVKLVANLDEPPEMNYVRKHYLEMKDQFGDKALVRLFSERPGDYGNKVNHLIETSNWSSGDDIAEVYTAHMGYGYGGDLENITSAEARELFKRLLSRVDVVSQVQSSVDYSIVDIDDYYAYLGGLSKAAEVYSGKKPLVLYTDLTQEKVRVEEAKDAIGFYVRTRLLNPKWIEGMRKHGYMGAQNIMKRVEHVLGLAATTGGVEDWIWDRIAETFVFNDEMRKWFNEANPYALEQIIRRLYEANQRGLWNASEDTIKKLKEFYAQLEASLEGISQWATQQA